ncbi:MAG: hypothetical protein CMG01_03140 [Candidatus Marinimicrobia bacterium]|nr:hypothetical protein [Candidatus Neomarinimicrobiota bacterium]
MIKNHIFLVLVFSSSILNACAVCYGAPDDPITQSLNKAILFLLFVIIFVLSCIMYSIFVLIKRSSNVQTLGD